MIERRPSLILPALWLLAAAGCASIASRPHPALHTVSPNDQQQPVSLFPADRAALSDPEIEKILSARPLLRPEMRVAVLHLEHRSVDFSWLYRSEPVPTTWLHEKLFAALRGAAGIHDASYLPAFLTPQKLTVGHLREAAARYQADLLLIFRTECRTHKQFRLFSASQAKAYCLADAGVIDVRTGLVPFSSRAVEQYVIDQQQAEMDLEETVRRSEQTAVEAAMAENGRNLAAFMESGRRPSGK